jgi:DNA-binding NarL/FixJ family response regulator
LEYTIEPALIVAETARGRKTIETSRIVWGAAASDSLDDVLAPQRQAPPEEISPEQEAILDLLQDRGTAMRTSEIAKELGRKDSATSNLLYRLLDKGKVSRGAGYGFWVLTQAPSVKMNVESGVNSESTTEKEGDLHNIHRFRHSQL